MASSELASNGGNEPVMPLRVIDVEKTVTHSESGGIYFTRSPIWHVISHTWSSDIRFFSCIIGEKILHQHHAVNQQSYAALFESAGFQSNPAYQKLIEFLIILQTEGVQWTWLDAVCINQTNTEEKDHEIQHMGDYYQRAKGCHVLQHGFGKGFELLLAETDGRAAAPAAMVSLPRWFTRAWTFQEWLLPPKVTFIVDLSTEQWLSIMSCRVFLSRSTISGTSCFCCEIQTTIAHTYLDKCQRQHQYPGEEDNLSMALARFRKHGGHCNEFPENSHFRDVPGKSHWYFADDLGYSFLLRLKFHLEQLVLFVPAEDPSSKHMGDAEFELTRRLGLKQFIMSGSECWPEVVVEIAMRDCSNSEDRVLSVLKLLGVQNVMQVRTGNTLNVQMLHLVHSFFKSGQEQLLVQWCLVDGFGNETAGMSWMPQFVTERGTWQEGARLLALTLHSRSIKHESFQAEMRCIGVSPKGVLNVEAHVCSATLLPCSAVGSCDRILGIGRFAYCKAMTLEVEGQAILDMHAHVLENYPTTCFLTNEGDHTASTVNITFEAPDHGLVGIGKTSYPIWLLKAGINVRYASFTDIYWLVCVGCCPSTLHKIGYFHIDLKDTTRVSILTSHSQKMHCSIGGLGHMHLFGGAPTN